MSEPAPHFVNIAIDDLGPDHSAKIAEGYHPMFTLVALHASRSPIASCAATALGDCRK